MSTRLEMIKRMAETDGYWSAYLDGMRDAHSVGGGEERAADFAEHARLIEARLDRAEKPARRASFMSDKISMDEARAKVADDWDNEYTPAVIANAADLGSPRIP